MIESYLFVEVEVPFNILKKRKECNHLQTRTHLYEEAIIKRREPSNAVLYPN